MRRVDVDAMLDEISWDQFMEWMAYDEVEPFGERRADWHFASLCSVFTNITLATRGSRKRFKPSDFLLEFGDKERDVPAPEPERQHWQQQKMIAKMFAAIGNADEAKRVARQKKTEERRARSKKPAAPERPPRKPKASDVDRARALLKR